MSAKKKTISRVLCLVMIVVLIIPALLVVPASAEATVLKSGSCGTNVNYTLYDDGLLLISGIGKMKDYSVSSSSKAPPWYSSAKKIQRIVIDEGVTYVGAQSFRKYGNNNTYAYVYTSLSLPSTLTSIGEMAFAWSDGLTSLELPDGLLSIGANAFWMLQGLTSPLVIPSSVTVIEGNAFMYCGATEVIFEGNIPPVMTSAIFSTGSNTKIQKITVPYGAKTAYQESPGLTGFVGFLNEGAPPVTYPSSAENPSFIKNLTNATHYYLQGVTADPLVVEAVVDDGGTIEYEWRLSGDLSGMVYGRGASFVPPTSIPGEYKYVCVARNKVYNPNVEGEYIYSADAYSFSDTVIVVASSTDPSEPEAPTTPDYSDKFDDLQNSMDEMPDKITDGMQDIMEQEKEQATQQGGQFVDDITGVVPNDSQGFIDALGSLVSVLSYDGTECVLPIPALTLPAISGLFPSYTVMEAQEVDFEEFFAMMPPAIMLLVQSLLTVALIVYCFKELYDTVAYFFVLKGGNK